MDSAESHPCSFRKNTPPVDSQAVQRDTCMALSGEALSCLGDVVAEDHHDHVKKEEPEDEADLCEVASSSLQHLTPVDRQSNEELEDKDSIRMNYSGEISASVRQIPLIDQQKHVIKDEPEDEDCLCGGTSSCEKHISHVDQQNEEVLKKEIKEEESKDDDCLRKTAVCEINPTQLQAFTCSWCPLVCISQIDLHKHIRRCHYEEHKGLMKSGEMQYEKSMPAGSSDRQQTVTGTFKCSIRQRQMQEGVFYCLDSGKSFTDPRTHKCIRKAEKPHHCSDCGKNFAQQSQLQRHQRVHTGEKPYRCSQRGKTFSGKNSLKGHQCAHTGEKPHQCLQCGKSFAQLGNLQRHQRVHNGGKPYNCSQCGKSFAQQANLHRHQRVHSGEKPFYCSQCGMCFTQQSNLRRHQRIHSGEKPFHCSQCGKSFSNNCGLQTHQLIHTGGKPYSCSECGKSFMYKSDFKVHQRIHTGEKPYNCSECGKRFTTMSNFQRHQRIHTAEKPHRCSLCGRGFIHENQLQKHQRVHTGEKPYRCSQCGKSFGYKRPLEKHQRSHVHTAETPIQCLVWTEFQLFRTEDTQVNLHRAITM